MLWFIVIICAAVFVYHHCVYPLLLKICVTNEQFKDTEESPIGHRECPNIGVFITAYNEAEFIEEKLKNLACQIYPNDKFSIHVVDDGSTDQTATIVRRVLGQLHNQFIYCTFDEMTVNSGKVAALNFLINKYRSEYDIIVFTDVSALLGVDCFSQVAKSMQENSTVAVSGNYLPNTANHENLDKYWHYQNAIRALEGQLGAVNGFAGAMFAMRAEAVTTLKPQTINDDFVQVVTAVNKENRACFNQHISIIECETDNGKQDFKRRMRIGAGNWQQIADITCSIRGFSVAQSFSFFSNKVLRGVMPLLLLGAYVALTVLAFQGDSLALKSLIALAGTHTLGLIKALFNWRTKLYFIDTINYIVGSYFAALLGILSNKKYKKSWRRVAQSHSNLLTIAACKRLVDIVGACVGLVLALPIILLAAIAIKIDSKGSVFYKQLRVGRLTEYQSELIYVYKLRTMRQDAEKQSGAVWAKGDDPRITRVGKLLRKTRIDELPQLWNVLKGDMSLIGPRPERPTFYTKLEREIPYFIQRTYGIKPGISGLAQVMNGYDESVDDVRNKIAWDYAYVLSMSRLSTWLAMESDIFIKTIKVVVLGKGQ